MHRINTHFHCVILIVLFILPLKVAADCSLALASLTCQSSVLVLDTDAPKPTKPAYLNSLKFLATNTAFHNVSQGLATDSKGNSPSHRYSRRQAWNADETTLDLGSVFLDAEDFSKKFGPIDLTTERNWSNKNPNWIYGIRADPKPNIFGRLDLTNNQFETFFELNDFETCSIGAGEGNLSNDDSMVVLACKGDNRSTTLIAFDLVELKELGRLKAKASFNWASFSQTGKYIVVENNGQDLEGNKEEELLRYDPNLQNPLLLTMDRNHGDLGIDANGRDVFVMLDWYRVSYIDLESNERIRLSIANKTRFPGHGHISCRNIQRPGWCFLSGDETGALGAFYLRKNESILGKARSILLDGAVSGVGVYEPWGFHYSKADSYQTQPQVSASPSGRQLIFTSDWGQGGTVDYVVRPIE